MRTLRSVLLVIATPLVLAAVGLVHPHLLSSDTADRWVTLHIVLLPVFPLLALGLVVPLWGRPRGDVAGAATVVAWICAFVYAAFYTGLDTVAGVAAGTVAREGEGVDIGPLVQALFDTGDALGYVGAYALGLGVLAAAVALVIRYGVRTVPGSVVLLAASYSFVDSHIFWPRGVYTMLGFALGFGLIAMATPKPQAGPRPISS
jgi:hypothetical protein